MSSREECVCCGSVIPEGSQYCYICGHKAGKKLDLVEVVRCKDCKHWGDIAYGFICRKFSGIDTKICMGSEQYCSYGERDDTK